MQRKTYVIIDTDKKFYCSHTRMLISTAHEIPVIRTDTYSKAKKFHSLFWATYIAKYLSCHSFGYYYVFEVIKGDSNNEYKIMNREQIEKIRKADEEDLREVENIINKWKKEHCADKTG